MTIKILFLIVIGTLLTGTFACGPNAGVLRDGKENRIEVNSAPAKVGIEADIDAMTTAGYGFIYVIRRKDGGVIDGADKGVLRLTTGDANRRIESDGGKAFVVAAIAAIPAEKFAKMNARFDVRVVSGNAEANANVNK